MMIILMNMPRVGPSNMGIAGGLWYTFGEIGGVLGPTLVGVISGILSLLAAVSALLLATTLLLQRTVQRDVAT